MHYFSWTPTFLVHPVPTSLMFALSSKIQLEVSCVAIAPCPQTPKGGFHRKEKLVERSATIGVLRYKFTIGQLLTKSHGVVQFARRSRAKLKLPATLDS